MGGYRLDINGKCDKTAVVTYEVMLREQRDEIRGTRMAMESSSGWYFF
ncbi:hypothetical protein ES703_91014 [subsurface metagenome]